MIQVSSLQAPNWKPITFSVYSNYFHGRVTASRAVYDRNRMTCATNMYPLGTYLEIEYKGRKSTVKVTDRIHPRFAKTRIDLSGAAFRSLYPKYDMRDSTGTLLKGKYRVIK